MENASRSVGYSDSLENWHFLLFYQYCDLIHPTTTCLQQEELCSRLNLRGRIRVSSEGINGTLSGSRSSLASYMTTINETAEFNAEEKPIHWKISGLSETQLMTKTDYKFQSLSVKVVKEVVSLDLSEGDTEKMIRAGPGKHLSPHEFHDLLSLSRDRGKKLQSVTDSCRETDDCNSKNIHIETEICDQEMILLDVRNYYETRVGNFQLQNHCGEIIGSAIDPRTRQFSDFAKFVDKNIDDYRGKKVLMYCTGGVRCERASSYLRSKGIDDVSQLSGGIHAYQETFPEGGYFRGKNFVFDPRIVVPSAANTDDVIGTCCVCSRLYDDYSRQCRCSKCRVLVLVCDDCVAPQQAESEIIVKPLLCEQCLSEVSHHTS